MHWRDRAQKNKRAVQPLIVITRGWNYDKAYREGANDDMHVLQDWLYHEVGKTWRVLPAVRVNSDMTAEEHAARNIYFDIMGPAAGVWDRSGMPVNFCNPLRLYVLYSTGYTGLKNMAGRQAFNCPPSDAALKAETGEEWGPGVAGGPSGWAMELAAGHDAPDTPAGSSRNASRGALLHEILHCLGVQHPNETIDGPQAWLSPMAGWWFGVPGADNNGNPVTLLEREKAQLRESPFFR